MMPNPHLPTRLRRRSSIALSCVVCAALVTACSDGSEPSEGSEGTAGGVLASTSIWADVTSNVACGADVPALIPAGSDAHSHQPSVQDADALRRAELVVTNGLGLEEGLRDALRTASADGVEVIELAPALSPLDGSTAARDHAGDDHAGDDHAGDDHADDRVEPGHGGDDHGHDVDPHVWLDPDRVAAAVPVIAEALRQVEGIGLTDARIQDCAEEYVDQLRALSREMDEELAAIEPDRRKLVTNHESLGYFADRFDLEVVGAVVPSTSSLAEANARDLDELEAIMREEGVDTIFAETTGATSLADALAQRLGADAAVVELHTEALDPDDGDASTYLGMMRSNARLVAGALSDGLDG